MSLTSDTKLRLPVRCAIVGCGRMGRWHAERLRDDGRGVVTALVDPSRETAIRLQHDFSPTGHVYDDFAEFLAAENDVDAVVICTPTPDHFPQIRGCRSRGWHVLCEKPLAHTRDEIVTLIEECNAGGPILSVGYQRRYSSLFRTLRREVRSGKWGRIRAITSHNVENWQQTIGGTWRDNPAINRGGFIGDAGSHKLDMLFFLTGLKPISVTAHTDRCGSHVEIAAGVLARLEGDIPLMIDFIGHAQYLGEDLHIHCEHADLMIRDNKFFVGENGEVRELLCDEPNSNPAAGFLDEILEGADPVAPPECALPVFDMTTAILESSRMGETVRLSFP
ncbi:MAG: Gfo/Idh/MocA family oxidoreductase [Planctomycetaceae bacterium]